MPNPFSRNEKNGPGSVLAVLECVLTLTGQVAIALKSAYTEVAKHLEHLEHLEIIDR
jgi:hypothetical protein